METKHCPRCGHIKSRDEFYKRSTVSERPTSYCKSCAHEYQRKWRTPQKARKYNFKFRWGTLVTPEQFSKLIQDQNGKCANLACGHILAAGNGKRAAHLDHDHATNAIRGVLCGECNRASGLCGDDPVVLRGLAEYQEKHLARAAA